MKVLVAYRSQTGNTRKVAGAIYGETSAPKEIKRVEEVASLEGYDFAFLGFPIEWFGPGEKAKQFLEKHAKGKTVALFITHASLKKVGQF
jgi:flavodoxin